MDRPRGFHPGRKRKAKPRRTRTLTVAASYVRRAGPALGTGGLKARRGDPFRPPVYPVYLETSDGLSVVEPWESRAYARHVPSPSPSSSVSAAAGGLEQAAALPSHRLVETEPVARTRQARVIRAMRQHEDAEWEDEFEETHGRSPREPYLDLSGGYAASSVGPPPVSAAFGYSPHPQPSEAVHRDTVATPWADGDPSLRGPEEPWYVVLGQGLFQGAVDMGRRVAMDELARKMRDQAYGQPGRARQL
jgi:hypothetical protein